MITQRNSGRYGAAAPSETSAELQHFFEELARAVTSGDGKAAAALWAIPALILGDREAKSVATRAELESFLGGARQQYNEKGITDTRPQIMQVKWITPRIARVQVRWPYLDATGREVGSEASTYTLRRDEQGALKIQVAVTYGTT